MDNLYTAGNKNYTFERFISDISEAASRRKRPDTDKVLEDLDVLSRRLDREENIGLLQSMGMTSEKASAEIRAAERFLSREHLGSRLRKELGELREQYEDGTGRWETRTEPLGVVFHVCAGNMDALPFYSVVEGLLTGNINVIKLPGSGDEITLKLTEELLKIDGSLKDSIFIADISSAETAKLREIAGISNAVVIWGGDEAVRAVRQLAPVNCRIIEWGHRVSFAYVSTDPGEEILRSIAENICSTEGLFCTSIQGIYLDTDDEGKLMGFAERFHRILSKVSADIPGRPELAARGTVTSYTYMLERGSSCRRISDSHATVIADNDPEPQIFGPRTVFVKKLPRQKIFERLSYLKDYLSSVSVYSDEEHREEIIDSFIRCGATRIADAEVISETLMDCLHDGRYPLRELVKTVAVIR